MRIGIDASRYADKNATGVEWYSHYIINALLKLISEEVVDEVVLYSRTPLKIDKKITQLTTVNNVVSRRVLNAKRLWTLFALSLEMRNAPPDALFVPSHVLPLIRPKRSIITIHDVAFKHLRSSYSFFSYLYLNWSTKYAVKHATQIIVPSIATKNDLISLFKCPENKVDVVYHGFSKPHIKDEDISKVINTSVVFKHFDLVENSKYILFVGRLESKKNLVRLVSAFAEFREKNPDYRLVLAGKRGKGFDQILNTVKELKLLDSVIMPGYVTEQEKAALYKDCCFFAFPSLYEGFGLPILESFFWEKPVLTSNVSCLPEIAEDAACYCDPLSVSSIVKGMNKLAADSKYRAKLVSLGNERIKDFLWSKSAKETLKIIKGYKDG